MTSALSSPASAHVIASVAVPLSSAPSFVRALSADREVMAPWLALGTRELTETEISALLDYAEGVAGYPL